MNQRRKEMEDKKLGRLVDREMKEIEARATFSFPPKLWNALKTILEAHQQDPFLKDDAESSWFAKKFPKFLLCEKY